MGCVSLLWTFVCISEKSNKQCYTLWTPVYVLMGFKLCRYMYVITNSVLVKYVHYSTWCTDCTKHEKKRTPSFLLRKKSGEMVVISVVDSDHHCTSKIIIKNMQWRSLSAKDFTTYFLRCGILLVNVNIAHTANLDSVNAYIIDNIVFLREGIYRPYLQTVWT